MSSINKKSRPARRVKRGQHSLRRWQFEQLESRAMLAVMGPMPYYGGDHGPQLQSFHDSPQFEAAVFAPPQFQQNVVAGPLDRGWGGGAMQGGFHDDRFMFRQYVVIEVWNVVPPNQPTARNRRLSRQIIWILDQRPIATNLGTCTATANGNVTVFLWRFANNNRPERNLHRPTTALYLNIVG